MKVQHSVTEFLNNFQPAAPSSVSQYIWKSSPCSITLGLSCQKSSFKGRLSHSLYRCNAYNIGLAGTCKLCCNINNLSTENQFFTIYFRNLSNLTYEYKWIIHWPALNRGKKKDLSGYVWGKYRKKPYM